MTGVVNGDPTTKGGLAVAMRGATDAVVLVTGLTGTGTGNVRETGTEDTAIATTTDTAIAIGIETTRETVDDAGVKKTATTYRKTARKGNVARTVQTSHLILILGTAHAGALRGLFPGILIVIDILGILAILETNSTTRPGMERIAGVAAMNAALAMMMILFDANRPRLLCRGSLLHMTPLRMIR